MLFIVPSPRVVLRGGMQAVAAAVCHSWGVARVWIGMEETARCSCVHVGPVAPLNHPTYRCGLMVRLSSVPRCRRESKRSFVCGLGCVRVCQLV